jgi:hypothetical protein
MKKEIILIVIGLILCVVGLTNRNGKPSVIHWYNYAKVSESDRPKYGRAMGNAVLSLGCAMLLTSVQFLLFGPDQSPVLLGFGALTEEQMKLGVNLLYKAWM